MEIAKPLTEKPEKMASALVAGIALFQEEIPARADPFAVMSSRIQSFYAWAYTQGYNDRGFEQITNSVWVE